ncbi:serine hydrolase [Aurantimonas coralicida]|uniref:serine hydrolase n=1 Tax=Aurantimonas coralicida TaxID=182270 RepID=UPI002E7C309B|nr:SPOR domain-containing protein [Aurantimonas coralicida]
MRNPFPRLTTAARSLSRFAGVVAFGAGMLLTGAGHAEANAKYAGFVIDANNGQVLYNDRADEYRYPASLTKMMTLYMTFDALKSGRISMKDKMPVSAYAAGRPPSKIGLKTGSTLTVEEAVYSLVTKSANDAAVVLGEFQAGSESAFAARMTAKARQIGMPKTTFRNANGLPDSGQKTTARDMATLGIALREHFPEYYKIFSTRSYSFRGRRLGNHNRVLGRVKGVDGIKTGYINASGFNLVTSIERDGKSLVAVVMGGRSGRSRDDHMVELLTRYLPKASTRDSGMLLAARSASPAIVAALPKQGPVPDSRPAMTEIDQRIAMAYGSEAAPAVARMVQPQSRPIVGRDALKAALVAERPSVRMPIPAASRVPSAGVRLPPAAVPGGRDLDPSTTGAIKVASVSETVRTPSSPWVVQIAATPEADAAMEMLATAKRKVGSELADAEPFTETVKSGSQTLYRARFAGFASKDQAWSACAALKRSSYSCYAVAN